VKIWQYLNVTKDEFKTKYHDTRLVDVATHDEFPLQMLTYGREAVHGNVWDSVTTKCRGIIFNTETDEIVARPFEKFFNLGTANMPETEPEQWVHCVGKRQWMLNSPEVWEKMDGFLCTLYEYKGKAYIASKGSFHSTHAKWATAWYREQMGTFYHGAWPTGYTPVFEGICSSLRIVVGYEFEGLVLLALVNNETGEELNRESTKAWAVEYEFRTPSDFNFDWREAQSKSMNPETTNVEGYVLVWRRPGQTPFRLKVKYVDYLRLHRMVSGVSAKAIYNCLAGNEYKGDLDEWMDESTPWFSKFVNKWVRSLTFRHDELMGDATRIFTFTQEKLKQASLDNWDKPAIVRKAYAEAFAQWPDVKGILFAMYDGKDAKAVAWKLVKPMIKGSQPMLDVSKM
jgi:RNA ligase